MASAITSKEANVPISQTDSVLVAAQAGVTIRVYGVVLSAQGSTATQVTFNSKSGGAGTAISPGLMAPANSTASADLGGIPLFQTNAGEGLSVNTGTGSTVGILVVYDTI